MARIRPITDPSLGVSWLGASSIEVWRVVISLLDGIYSSLGIQPVDNEARTDTQFKKIFFVWFSSNCNILSFVNRDLWVPLWWWTHIQIFCWNSRSSRLWARPPRRVSRYPILQYSVLRPACLSVLFFSVSSGGYTLTRDLIGQHGARNLGCDKWSYRDTLSGNSSKPLAQEAARLNSFPVITASSYLVFSTW